LLNLIKNAVDPQSQITTTTTTTTTSSTTVDIKTFVVVSETTKIVNDSYKVQNLSGLVILYKLSTLTYPTLPYLD
jgi:hypothetical protein